MVTVISNVSFLINTYHHHVKNKTDGDADMFHYSKVIHSRQITWKTICRFQKQQYIYDYQWWKELMFSYSSLATWTRTVYL